MFRALILRSRVDGAVLSLAAAPDGPEIRPLLSASADSIISRSLRGSSKEGTTDWTAAAGCDDSRESHNSSTEKTSPELRMMDLSMTFCQLDKARFRGCGPGIVGACRWSARRKVSVVLELLRGADLESTSRKCRVNVATLTEWRDRFLAGGAAILKTHEVDVEDEEKRHLKSAVASISVDDELLREKVANLASGRPLAFWKSKP